MGLLDDLKKQAAGVRSNDEAERETRQQNAQVVEDAMQRAFRYLHDLLEQLKIIKPVNPVVYRLPGVGEFRDLAMGESFVSSRTRPLLDHDYLHRIDFYIVWSLGDDLVIERDIPPAAEKVRDLLWRSNMKFIETATRNDAGAALVTRFLIPQAINMAITLRADYDERRVIVLAKNVLRMGNDEFAVSAQELVEPVLEDMARMLIGQQSGFRRYRIVLSPDSWAYKN